MAIQRNNILRGPGTVIIDGVAIHDASGITCDVDVATQEIPSSISGPIDTIKTDQIGKVTLTPVGVLSDDIIAALFPWLDPQIGASVFGSTDKALVVHSLAGTKVTFVNGHLTKMPEIYLSPVKTAFGSAEFTGLLGLGKAPGDTNSVYKVESATYSSGAPQPDGITGAQYVGTFGSLSITDTQDGWTVTPEIELEPVQTDNLGTVDYTIAGLKVTATCTPLGLTESQIMAALPITLGRGSSMRGTNDLVISGGSGALEVTLKNATLVKGPLAWGNTTLRAGQIQFTAHRSFTNGAAGAVWDIGIASDAD